MATGRLGASHPTCSTSRLSPLGAVVILATLFAPQVIATQTFMTPGESADQAVFFFRFFAVQVLFLGLGALARGDP